MDQLEQIIEQVASDPAIKGCVIATGKDNFSGGADLTMLQGLGRAYEQLKAEQGEEVAMRHFFEASRRLSLLFRRLETCGKPFAAAIQGLCLGGAFELALACHSPGRLRRRKDPGRPAGDQGRPVPGRRRHAAGRPADADRRRPPDAVQGRADPRAHGQGHGADPRGGAAGRDRRARQGLDPRGRLGGGAMGRAEVQGAVRQGLLARRHDDLAPGQRDLPARDPRQLPGREGDPGLGVRGSAAADGPRPAGREPVLRAYPALHRGGGDDPHAVHLHGRAEQGRAPPEGRAGDQPAEGRRDRRRLHGRGRRLRDRAGRDRGGARRPVGRGRREGQVLRPHADHRPDQQGPRQDAPTATRCSARITTRRPTTARSPTATS